MKGDFCTELCTGIWNIVPRSTHKTSFLVVLVCHLIKKVIGLISSVLKFLDSAYWNREKNTRNGIKVKSAVSFNVGLRVWVNCNIYWHGLSLIPARINNQMHNEVWGEIIYPFQNASGATVDVWESPSLDISYLEWPQVTKYPSFTDFIIHWDG